MRRVLLLGLLALALPTAVLASSIDPQSTKFGIQFTTGSFIFGSFGTSPPFTNPFTVTVFGKGTPNSFPTTIMLSSDTLMGSCARFASTCHFSSGTVDITIGPMLFIFSAIDGTIKRHGNRIDITAITLPTSPYTKGIFSLSGVLSSSRHGRLRTGDATVETNLVPEPATLVLLGTGLIGLAGLVRRKFKLPT